MQPGLRMISVGALVLLSALRCHSTTIFGPAGKQHISACGGQSSQQQTVTREWHTVFY